MTLIDHKMTQLSERVSIIQKEKFVLHDEMAKVQSDLKKIREDKEKFQSDSKKFRENKERLVFCFYCSCYTPQIHQCPHKNLWINCDR